MHRAACGLGAALAMACAGAPPPARAPQGGGPATVAAAAQAPAATAPSTGPQLTGPLLPAWESIEAARGAGLGEYRLNVSDVVDIMVAGHDDLRKELPIRPDGKISFSFVGDVPAAGRTTAELRAGLEEQLGRYLRFPQVTVVVKKAHEAQFAILGKVVQPGMYPITGRTTIISGIAMAQGLASGQYEGSTIEVADLHGAFLVRRGKVVPVDFEALIHRGDTRQDVELEDGDYLYLPSALAQEVYILGEVFKPRSYGFRGRVTLLQAVAESGGFRPSARLGDVVILREVGGQRQVLRVDVKAVLAGKVPMPELAVGDVVFVPRRGLATFAEIMNEVMPSLLALQLGRAL